MLTSTSCGIKDENSPPTSRSFVPIYGYTDTFAWDECARVILHTMHNEWSSRCKNLVSHLARRTKCCEQRGPCWVILLFFSFLFFFLFFFFLFHILYLYSNFQFYIFAGEFYRLARFKENILSNFVEYKKKKKKFVDSRQTLTHISRLRELRVLYILRNKLPVICRPEYPCFLREYAFSCFFTTQGKASCVPSILCK